LKVWTYLSLSRNVNGITPFTFTTVDNRNDSSKKAWPRINLKKLEPRGDVVARDDLRIFPSGPNVFTGVEFKAQFE